MKRIVVLSNLLLAASLLVSLPLSADGFLFDKPLDEIDGINAEKLLGLHWPGREMTGNMEDVYLCNVETGEYLDLGDMWGSSAIASHIGIPLYFEKGTSVLGYDGYWICQTGVGAQCALGRVSHADGAMGSFEMFKYLYLRTKGVEYHKRTAADKLSGDNYPGAFVWVFHPVKEDLNGGYEYVIYTKRATDLNDNNKLLREFGNRESYLCLQLQKAPGKDYNVIRFKKFAGTMHDGFLDSRVGDEKNYTEREVSLEEGLAELAKDNSARWKIVTQRERKRYRLTASADQPVDISFNISNNKFYSSYCEMYSGQHRSGYSWNWEDDRSFNAKDVYDAETPLRKVGVGYNYMVGFGHSKGSDQVRTREHYMTQGHEANFAVSMYNTPGKLTQKITELREGNYIIYCKGFYAPNAMMNYVIDENGQAQYNAADIKMACQPQASDKAFLFATSENKTQKRRLPSIFEAWVPERDLASFSKEEFMQSDDFKYTNLGSDPNGARYQVSTKERLEWMKDNSVFARIKGQDLGRDANEIYYLPKTIDGAGRFFDATKNTQAQKFRVGVPITVGESREITIGVEYTGTEGDKEWVCFDDFELIYLGKDEPDILVMDEDNPANNTLMTDIFDPKMDEGSTKVMKKLVIHRSLDRNKWSTVTLPVTLTKAQFEETFGKGSSLAIVDRLVWKTLHFEFVQSKGDNEPYLIAGKSYIIRPTDFPVVQQGSYYTKVKVENRDGVTEKIAGPIYFLDDFPVVKGDVYPDGKWVPAEKTKVDKLVSVVGDTSGKKYRVVADGSYEPYTIKPQEHGAYFYELGKMYYATRETPVKGFSNYIYLEEEGTNAKFTDAFVDGNYEFYEVDDDGVTSIDKVENSSRIDGSFDIYDLQGRRVEKPGKGIYIINGKKVIFD